MTPTNQLAIPFNKAYLTGDESGYMAQAMANGPLTGDGPFTKRASALLTEILGAVRHRSRGRSSSTASNRGRAEAHRASA